MANNSNHQDVPELLAELDRTRKALRRFNPRGSTGRRILITGGLGFTGLKLVETFREALPDADFCVADFPRSGTDKAWEADSSITYYPVDFLETGSVNLLVNKIAEGGNLTDAIVLHGGGGRPEWELPREPFDLSESEIRILNFESVYELLRLLLHRGLLRGSKTEFASATAVSSISRYASWRPPKEYQTGYGGAKNDLYHAMLYLACRVGGEHFVRFNVVSPGTLYDTCTPAQQKRMREISKLRLPMHSYANGYNISEAILAFTELGRKTTGAEIRVDGGQYFVPHFRNNEVRESEMSDALEKGRRLVEELDAKFSDR